MKLFIDDKEQVWTLTNCKNLDKNTIIGTILGNGGNKIFNVNREVTFVDSEEGPIKNKNGSYTYNMKFIENG